MSKVMADVFIQESIFYDIMGVIEKRYAGRINILSVLFLSRLWSFTLGLTTQHPFPLKQELVAMKRSVRNPTNEKMDKRRWKLRKERKKRVKKRLTLRHIES